MSHEFESFTKDSQSANKSSHESEFWRSRTEYHDLAEAYERGVQWYYPMFWPPVQNHYRKCEYQPQGVL